MPLFTFKLTDPPCDPHYLSLIDTEALYNATDAHSKELQDGTLRQVGWHPMNLPDEWFMSQHRCHTVRQLTRVMQCTIQYLHAQLKHAEKHVRRVTAALRECDAERDAAFEEVVQLRETVSRQRRAAATDKPLSKAKWSDRVRDKRTRMPSPTTRNRSGSSRGRSRNVLLECTVCGNTYPSRGSLQSHMHKRHKTVTRSDQANASVGVATPLETHRADSPRGDMQAARPTPHGLPSYAAHSAEKDLPSAEPHRGGESRHVDSLDNNSSAVRQLQSEVMDMHRMLAQLVHMQQQQRQKLLQHDAAQTIHTQAEDASSQYARRASAHGQHPLLFIDVQDAAHVGQNSEVNMRKKEHEESNKGHVDNRGMATSTSTPTQHETATQSDEPTRPASPAVHVLHDAMSSMASRMELLERMLRGIAHDRGGSPSANDVRQPPRATPSREEHGAPAATETAEPVALLATRSGDLLHGKENNNNSNPATCVDSNADENRNGTASDNMNSNKDAARQSEASMLEVRAAVPAMPTSAQTDARRHDTPTRSRSSTPSQFSASGTMAHTATSVPGHIADVSGSRNNEKKEDDLAHSFASYVAPRDTDLSSSVPHMMSYSALHIPLRGGSPASSHTDTKSETDTESETRQSDSPTTLIHDDTVEHGESARTPVRTVHAAGESKPGRRRRDGDSHDVDSVVQKQQEQEQRQRDNRMHAPPEADSRTLSSSSYSSSSSSSSSHTQRQLMGIQKPKLVPFQPRKYKSVATVVPEHTNAIAAPVHRTEQPSSTAATSSTAAPTTSHIAFTHSTKESSHSQLQAKMNDSHTNHKQSVQSILAPDHTTPSSTTSAQSSYAGTPPPPPVARAWSSHEPTCHTHRPARHHSGGRLAASSRHTDGTSSSYDAYGSEMDAKRADSTDSLHNVEAPKGSHAKQFHGPPIVQDTTASAQVVPVTLPISTAVSGSASVPTLRPRHRYPHHHTATPQAGQGEDVPQRASVEGRVPDRRDSSNHTDAGRRGERYEEVGRVRTTSISASAVPVVSIAAAAAAPPPTAQSVLFTTATPQSMHDRDSMHGNDAAANRKPRSNHTGTANVPATSAPGLSQRPAEQLAPQKKKRKLGGMIKRFFSGGRSKEHGKENH